MFLIQAAKLIRKGIAVSSISVSHNLSLGHKKFFHISALLCANNKDKDEAHLKNVRAIQLLAKALEVAASKNPNDKALASKAQTYFVISQNLAAFSNIQTTKEDQLKVDSFVNKEYKP